MQRFAATAVVVLVVLATVWWLFSDSTAPLPLDPPDAGSVSAEPSAAEPEVAAREPDVGATVADTPGRTAVEPIATRPPSLRLRVLDHDGVPLANVRAVILEPRSFDDAVAEAVGGADGSLALHDLPAGRYAMRMFGEGVPAGWYRKHVDVPVSGIDLGDVAMPILYRIEGTVESGPKTARIPVAGAKIVAWIGYTRGSSPVVATTTDENGRFVIERAGPGRWTVTASAPDLVAKERWVEVVADSGPDRTVKLVLDRGETVLGVVRDPTGAPVAGAEVFPETRLLHSAGASATTTTDESGRFALRALPSNTNTLTVSAPGFAPTDVSLWRLRQEGLIEREIVVTLRSDVPVTGRVVGTGASQAQVAITPDDGPSIDALYNAPSRPHDARPVEADGSFAIGGVPPGRYKVEVTLPGMAKLESASFSVPYTEPVVIELPDRPSLPVRVEDDLGAPIADAQVLARPREDPSPDASVRRPYGRHFRGAPTTDTDGHAEVFTPASPQPFDLFVQAKNGYSPAHLPFLDGVPGGGDRNAEGRVVVVLPRTGGIRGQCTLDGDYERFVCRVRATGPRSAQVPIGADGRFEFAGLPPGEYAVHLTRSDATSQPDALSEGEHVPPAAVPLLDGPPSMTFESLPNEHLRASNITVPPGETVEVALDRPELGTIHGRVLGSSGPVAGAWVFAAREGDDNDYMRFSGAGVRGNFALDTAPRIRTDADGRFTFHVDRPATYQLRARHPDSPMPTDPIEIVVERIPSEVDATLLLAGGLVRGSLDLPFDAESPEHTTANVWLVPDDLTESTAWVHVDSMLSWDLPSVEAERKGGTFEFRFVPPGNWVLRIGFFGSLFAQRFVHLGANDTIDLGVVSVDRVPVEIPFEVRGVACTQSPVLIATRLFGDGQVKAYDCVLSGNADLDPVDPSQPPPEPHFGRVTVPMHGTATGSGQLAPGRYLLDLAFTVIALPPSTYATGSTAEVRVLPDGTIEPARLVFGPPPAKPNEAK